MVNKEFVEQCKNDKELQLLRQEVYAITGRLSDISFCLGKDTVEGMKERLRKIIENHRNQLSSGESECTKCKKEK